MDAARWWPASRCTRRVRRNSAICLLLAAIAGVGSLLAGWEWIFAPGTFTASRWLLALSAARSCMAGLALRDSAPRQAELLIDAAGLAILFIGVPGLVRGAARRRRAVRRPASALPDFWELIVFGAGVGLLAFGALDRSPGPAWLGFANLVVFIVRGRPRRRRDALLLAARAAARRRR